MKRHILAWSKYLSYVLRHKYYVAFNCFSKGLYWQGLTHDLSKLLPSEFFPYAHYFYLSKTPRRDKTGYYKPTDTGDAKFDWAWLQHIHRNRHHWQHYCLIEDDTGQAKALPMPERYIREMVCDWSGAGKAQHNTAKTIEWYLEHKNKMILHPDSRERVEDLLEDWNLRG